MKLTPSKINTYLLFKLPSAYIVGVRVKQFSTTEATVAVKFRWVNQNPFRSMFWAVQGMAAELATGILVMHAIAASNTNISMLVTNMSATFAKKAKGTIVFSCFDGVVIKEAIKTAIATGDGQTVIAKASGIDSNGDTVSSFTFEWSLKVKS
ncbi:DUF4442 domain-containing protein [Tenacibaculum sp. SG-28]|uniref:DUF4442 domain-containing protein n=1 Tax=Tenacibaculum sp. SG-28 TaxID=754426 RepID=UPI000CF4A1DD|nr:DUF4442 domain-containing protein [Tenacibaculum sp. SG-28]PQJ19723.1 thioesterase [Tenacibaculum sp. SG-28]